MLERQTLQSEARLTVELTIFVQFCSRKGRNNGFTPASVAAISWDGSISATVAATGVAGFFVVNWQAVNGMKRAIAIPRLMPWRAYHLIFTPIFGLALSGRSCFPTYHHSC
ncbi:MAG: hypothetical protein AAGD09_17565 [Cyanobacteria bacterium P01_F01_bin.56]